MKNPRKTNQGNGRTRSLGHAPPVVAAAQKPRRTGAESRLKKPLKNRFWRAVFCGLFKTAGRGGQSGQEKAARVWRFKRLFSGFFDSCNLRPRQGLRQFFGKNRSTLSLSLSLLINARARAREGGGFFWAVFSGDGLDGHDGQGHPHGLDGQNKNAFFHAPRERKSRDAFKPDGMTKGAKR